MPTTNAFYLGREWNIDHDQRAKVSNAELRYTVLGEGEPVLCIHGTSIADSLITPLRFYPPLFDDYKLITYYRAGYNGSTLEKSALSIEEGAEHVKQLLDQLGIAKAHILAFSFGGVIGFQFLLSYPERAHSAVLLEPYLPREEQAGVQANIDAFTRANELYQRGDEAGRGAALHGAGLRPDLPRRGRHDQPAGRLAAGRGVRRHDFQRRFRRRSPTGVSGCRRRTRWCSRSPTMPILAVMGIDSEAAMPGFRETQRFLMNWLPQAERCGDPERHARHAEHEPARRRRGDLPVLKRHPMT